MNLKNWYPGHMAKAMKEIKDKSSIVDCFIVLIDSRIPITSYNEEFDFIAPKIPRLFVFSKIDYSDETKLKETIKKFDNPNDQKVIVNLKDGISKTKILKSLNKILKEKEVKNKERGLLKTKLRCFVIGMPNTGKSTLINLLSSDKKTKVANFAGTTRSLQWISTEKIYLLDTPGILMPKINDEESLLKLIACKLIKEDIVNNYDFYIKILDILYQTKNINKIKDLNITYNENENEKYNQLVLYARSNNFYKKNKEIDIEKALLTFKNKIMNIKNIFWD